MRIHDNKQPATISNRIPHRNFLNKREEEVVNGTPDHGGKGIEPGTESAPSQTEPFEFGPDSNSMTDMLSWLIASGEFLPIVPAEENGGGKKGDEKASETIEKKGQAGAFPAGTDRQGKANRPRPAGRRQ